MSIVRVPFSLTGGAAAAYVPAGAIWLDGSADSLSITFSSSGDRDLYTRSYWLKRSSLGEQYLGSTGPDGGNNIENLYFDSSNRLAWTINDGNVTRYNYISTQVFRDLIAWTHIAVTRSGTILTLYVNGTAVSDFDTSTNTGYADGSRFTYTDINYIGRTYGGTNYFNGYLAEIVQLDGTADISGLGESDAKGNWIPKDPTGLTFGTNGFWLNFADSADLGNDVSGNNNDFTPTSLSSANSTSDRPADDATNGFGNYCLINPTAYAMSTARSTDIISDGNLSYDENGDADGSYLCTIAVNSGKWYFEVTNVRPDTWTQWAGVCRINPMKANEMQSNISGPPYPYVYNSYSGNAESVETGSVAYGAAWRTTNDVVGVALDLDTPAIWFHKNGTWQNSATVGEVEAGTTTNAAFTSITGPVVPLVALNDGKLSYNFGQKAFAYTAPTGFKALNTANLPAPTVTDPSAYFQTVLYTGNGTAIGSGGKAVTGVGFKPDFVWIKNRDAADSHLIFQVISGATKYIQTDDTTQDTGNNPAQATDTESLSTFDSDGFTLGNNVEVNTNAENYVAWCMKFGGTGSSNTTGSISSTVSVAAHGGASLIQHTGTGANGTVGHGMSIAPAMMIHKNLDTANNQLITYFDKLSTPATDYMLLNRSVAKQTGGTSFWNSTVPTSSVFSVGTNPSTNNNGDAILTFAFSRVSGLIGIGSYVGNGSTDGPYIVIDDGASGFRPAFLLTKDSTTTSDWTLWDSERNPYNTCDNVLFVEESSPENTSGNKVDFTANGFKVRTGGADVNESGSTFIYLAFAEYPFGGEGVAQAKAR